MWIVHSIVHHETRINIYSINCNKKNGIKGKFIISFTIFQNNFETNILKPFTVFA